MEVEKDFSCLIKPLHINISIIEEPSEKTFSGVYQNIISENSFKKFDSKVKKKVSNSSKNVTKYFCSYLGCNKLFGKRDRLIVHERTHTGERPFKCHVENCNRSYTRRFHLTRHLNVSHNAAQESKESYRCDKCLKILSNKHSLKKHMNKLHKEDRYSCKECRQSFRKQQHLKTHGFIHTGIKPYKCEFTGCETRFSVPSLLKRHALSHIKGRYSCPYDECPSKFDTYTDLRHHLSSDHLKICDKCGKEFNMLCRLRTHLQSHQEIREAYFCPFTPCERYYFDQKNLQSHICIKHDDSFKGYECPICDKWIVTKQKLKEHLTTHDLNKPEKIPKKKQRKPRIDKGIPKTDFAKLLSGYSISDNDEADLQPETFEVS